MTDPAARATALSIALASYNGEAFIGEQLASFLRQTRLPDEVVICDDGSTDRTCDIVRDFASTAPFPVTLHVQPHRLGYTRNFESAITRCRGDILFLSDQDDVWFEDKLATISGYFESDPNLHVVVNDQVMTDSALRASSATKLGNLRRLGLSGDALIEGCCTAVSRAWVKALLPIPGGFAEDLQAELSYDRWLNELAIALGVRRVHEEPLQFFRRHGSTTTRWMVSEPRVVGTRDLIATRSRTVPSNAWELRIRLLEVYASWLRNHRAALENGRIGDVDRALQALDHERRSHEARLALTREALPTRLLGILRLLHGGGYRYFFGWKSALRDIVRAHR